MVDSKFRFQILTNVTPKVRNRARVHALELFCKHILRFFCKIFCIYITSILPFLHRMCFDLSMCNMQ